MIRNGTSEYIHYRVWDAANGVFLAGDVANHTLMLIIDNAIVVPDSSPEEIAAGECRILVTAEESAGAKLISVAGVSSTEGVYIILAMVATDLLISGTSVVFLYTAWDMVANAPKTGDEENHTITIAQDNTSAAAGNSPVEVEADDVPGVYAIVATAEEFTGKAVSALGVSSTDNVTLMPTEIAPFTVDYPAEADMRRDTDYAEATRTGSAAIPTASQTLFGVDVDATEGNVTLPETDEVELAVTFGPSDSLTGTLVKVFALPLEVVNITPELEVVEI